MPHNLIGTALGLASSVSEIPTEEHPVYDVENLKNQHEIESIQLIYTPATLSTGNSPRSDIQRSRLASKIGNIRVKFIQVVENSPQNLSLKWLQINMDRGFILCC